MATIHVDSVSRKIYISQVYSKLTSDQEWNKPYEKFALHVKIRSESCSLSPLILQMEEKFEK